MQNDIGSEHALNGLHYPVEVVGKIFVEISQLYFNFKLHFVHIREGMEFDEALKHSNGIAAVGLFYQIANDGKNPSKAMDKLEDALKMVVEKGSDNDY